MTRSTILSSLLLFGAAVGWVQFSPPRAGESRTANTFLSTEAARRMRERTIPLGCGVLGLAMLVFGLRRRAEPERESRQEVA